MVVDKIVYCILHLKFDCLALRRATLNLLASPIVCGTALKSVSSVKPMLDMVVDYLPAPNHRPHRESVLHNANICALVFKVFHIKYYRLTNDFGKLEINF